MSVVEDVGGTFLVSLFIAAILYGVFVAQAIIYYRNYYSDGPMLKILVAVLCVIETTHTAFCIDFIYNYLITNFGNEAHLEHIYWSVGVTVMLGVVVSGVAHVFSIRRVWIMGRRNIALTILLVLLTLLRFALGMTTSSFLYTIPIWNEFHSRKLPFATLAAGLSSGAAVDLVVASALIVFLRRGRTGFDKADGRIKMLTIYAINTGVLTSVVSVLILITYACLRTELVFMGLVEIQSKLYANSLLASLNARSHVLKHGRATGEITTGLDSGFVIHEWRAPGASNQISGRRETVQMVDELPMDSLDKPRTPLAGA
ncbi:hypothetical protein NEOLEDRAFT_978086 [Neolentinus lepideus HHB14362 ss-1]|uniref:DUF6534 domain-containing protein n=1 Tax=Neolentinus lepideus HHB14362 ss-1 TaxID=1314782 RepID=A0A165N8T4_9AGAM|nr:hypothetical protein NEOLEDRAFT_978086 [Neolentinus lepideus HHB14362 ss-1]